MRRKKESLEEQLYRIGICVFLIGLLFYIVYFQMILPHFQMFPCTLYTFFGIYCPGCGGTRAVLALFQGHIIKAFWYHPLVPYGVFIYGGFMISHTLHKFHVLGIKGWKYHNWYLYVAVIIIVINVIIKNILKFKFNILM